MRLMTLLVNLIIFLLLYLMVSFQRMYFLSSYSNVRLIIIKLIKFNRCWCCSSQQKRIRYIQYLNQMKVTLIVALLVVFATSSFVRQNHDFWYTAPKKAATSGVPFGDLAWNYCDEKCLYLEKYYPGKDFVAIEFSKSIFTPNFAACYYKDETTTTYTLWNKVAKNKWFEDNCGKETEDYYALTKGDKPKYKIEGAILGIGIGTEINY